MRLAVVAVLGVAACADDPTLRVSVEHAVAVERTTISVYESDSLTCERIEFGDLDEDELEATRVALLTIDAAGTTTGSLADLSRTDLKMIVARGYIGDGLVTAGCKTHGEIVGRDEMTVETVRASSASIGQLSLESPDPFSLQVSLRDASGAALDKNPLSWRVYAPYGADPAVSPLSPEKDDASGVWHLAKPTCTNQNGVLRIHPVPPATVGGFAIQVRASWPIEKPPLISGFTRIDPGVHPTIPVPGLAHPCAVRRGTSGPPSLLCVEPIAAGNATIVLREYSVTESGGDVSLTKLADIPLSDQDLIAVYGVDRGSVRDVYAVTQRGRVIGLRSPSVAVTTGGSQNLFGSETATDAMLLPACGDNVPRLLLRTEGPTLQRLAVMPELGGAATTFHGVISAIPNAIGLRAVGCVSELTPKGEATLRHAAVVDVPSRATMNGRQVRSVVFDCVVGADAPQCFVDLPILLAGAGFTPDGYLAGANLDASGVVISEYAVLGDPTGYRRVEFGRVAAASIPKHIVYGNFDADDKPDAFWDVENLGGTATALQVTYAQLAGALPLSALSPSQGFTVDDVFIDDVTGDGKDDVIMVGKSFSDTGTPLGYGLLVIPTQVQAAAPGFRNGDDPCASP